jgi:uncharacterized membrane-anchored protein/uncharacterized membrane protein
MHDSSLQGEEKMTIRLIRTGSLLGIALILAGVIYFFASNWQGMDRLGKVGLSIGLMGLFYGSSAVFTYVMKRHDFLGRWLFVCGSLTFGITIALIGQIYNSHANSYWLFIIWLVPTVVFAWITKYEAFSVISVVLLELACWFYYFPSSYRIEWSEWQSFFLLMLFAVISGIVWIFSRSSIVAYLAYTAMHGWLFVMDVTGFLYGRDAWWTYVYALLFIGFFYYFFAVAKRRSYVLLTSWIAGSFLIGKYFRVIGEHFEAEFLLGGLVLAAAIVYGSVFLLKRVKHISSENTKGRIFLIVFQSIVTFVASLIAVASIMGLLMIWMESLSMYVLFAISVVGFVAPAFLGRGWNPTVRYTLLAVGYGLSLMTTWEISLVLFTVYTAVLLICYVWSADGGIRALTNMAVSLYSAVILDQVTNEERLVLLGVAALNGCLYWLGRRRKESRFLPLVLGMGALLLLTSMDVFAADVWYVAANILFIAVIFTFLFAPLFQNERYEQPVAWAYFWLYLVLKYYEFVWNLLDKSISLIIAGLLFFIGTAVLEKRKGLMPASPAQGLYRKWAPLLAIMVAQAVFAGYMVWDKEQHLRNGEVVKLELQPVDPRSFLQGDYMQLFYDISTIRSLDGSGKVQVVLRKDQDGVHRFADIYAINGQKQEEYVPKDGDVIINGTFYGNTVVYGIESYFVPEGEGTKWQEKARFAYVRVSEDGDALLEKISSE